MNFSALSSRQLEQRKLASGHSERNDRVGRTSRTVQANERQVSAPLAPKLPFRYRSISDTQESGGNGRDFCNLPHDQAHRGAGSRPRERRPNRISDVIRLRVAPNSRNEKTSVLEHGLCRHGSCQLTQQRLRVLQVWRIETFGEPAIDRTEQVLGLRALALVSPEPGEAQRCAQFPKLCALALRNSKTAAKAALRCGLLSNFPKQLPADSMYFRFDPAFLR